MSRTCFAQFTQLLTQAITPPSPPPLVVPRHTGLIVPFPARHLPKALYSDPITDNAFDIFNITGAAHRERRRKAIAELTKKKPVKYMHEDRNGGDGTSWEKRVAGVDGWDVGYEKCTEMFVKRKGKGAFRFERAVMEGCGGLGEEAAS